MAASEPNFDLAIVIGSFNNGGAERVASLLANTLTEQGFRVAALTHEGPQADHFKLNPAVRRIVLGSAGASGNPLQAVMANVSRLLALRRAIRQTRPRTVLSFHMEGNILMLIAAAGLGVRTVISERNDPRRPHKRAAWNILRRALYRFADAVTSNSRGNLGAMRDYVSERKLRYVPNPLVLPEDVPGAARREKEFLTVARYVPDKCLDVLIEAFSRIHERLPGWTAHLVGWGAEEKKLRHLCNVLGLQDKVIFDGKVENPAPFYRRAAIFVLPSRFEGMPNALLEAMSYSLPAIVTDATPGPLEMITDGENGLVVKAENAEELAQAMLVLAENQDLRQKLAAGQKERLRENELTEAVRTWVAVLEL